MRTEFNRALNDLRDDILLMASRVEHELDAALTALADVDIEKAREVYAADRIVNQNRFDIEDRCFTLIATQQPAAYGAALEVLRISADDGDRRQAHDRHHGKEETDAEGGNEYALARFLGVGHGKEAH